MKIETEVAKIRRKPEHIRQRYVLACTVFCTLIVVGVWFISLSAAREEAVVPTITEEQKQVFQDMRTTGQTVYDGTQEVKRNIENAAPGAAGYDSSILDEQTIDEIE